MAGPYVALLSSAFTVTDISAMQRPASSSGLTHSLTGYREVAKLCVSQNDGS